MTITPGYWTEAHATGGGRNGVAKLANGQLTVTMASPKEFGGSGLGHNPEELFAVGYAACYLGAMRFAANKWKLGAVPDAATVTARVGIGPRSDVGFGLAVELTVALPGVDPAVAAEMVARGHEICPYSHATQGNISVTTTLA